MWHTPPTLWHTAIAVAYRATAVTHTATAVAHNATAMALFRHTTHCCATVAAQPHCCGTVAALPTHTVVTLLRDTPTAATHTHTHTVAAHPHCCGTNTHCSGTVAAYIPTLWHCSGTHPTVATSLLWHWSGTYPTAVTLLQHTPHYCGTVVALLRHTPNNWSWLRGQFPCTVAQRPKQRSATRAHPVKVTNI